MSPPTRPVADLFRSLVGRRFPGGCDDCDAYQEVAEIAPGCYVITIRHDDWCPDLQLRERRSESRSPQSHAP
jgi:hypothetical protein